MGLWVIHLRCSPLRLVVTVSGFSLVHWQFLKEDLHAIWREGEGGEADGEMIDGLVTNKLHLILVDFSEFIIFSCCHTLCGT